METRTYTFDELLEKELCAICAGETALADGLARYTLTPFSGTRTIRVSPEAGAKLDSLRAEQPSPELMGTWAMPNPDGSAWW